MTGTDKKGPDFVAYHVRESNDGNGYWDRVGVAFNHRDGKGIDIRLNATPVDGHITLRERAQEYKQQQSQGDMKDLQREQGPTVD